MLGIPSHKLMEFKNDNDPLSLSLIYWLNGNVEEVPVSWSSVVEALESDHVGERGLAEKIRKTYCKQESKVVSITLSTKYCMCIAVSFL